jgi:hypothetical protein
MASDSSALRSQHLRTLSRQGDALLPRGPIVNDDAFHRALHEGWIAGAGVNAI